MISSSQGIHISCCGGIYICSHHNLDNEIFPLLCIRLLARMEFKVPITYKVLYDRCYTEFRIAFERRQDGQCNVADQIDGS